MNQCLTKAATHSSVVIVVVVRQQHPHWRKHQRTEVTVMTVVGQKKKRKRSPSKSFIFNAWQRSWRSPLCADAFFLQGGHCSRTTITMTTEVRAAAFIRHWFTRERILFRLLVHVFPRVDATYAHRTRAPTHTQLQETMVAKVPLELPCRRWLRPPASWRPGRSYLLVGTTCSNAKLLSMIFDNDFTSALTWGHNFSTQSRNRCLQNIRQVVHKYVSETSGLKPPPPQIKVGMLVLL